LGKWVQVQVNSNDVAEMKRVAQLFKSTAAVVGALSRQQRQAMNKRVQERWGNHPELYEIARRQTDDVFDQISQLAALLSDMCGLLPELRNGDERRWRSTQLFAIAQVGEQILPPEMRQWLISNLADQISALIRNATAGDGR
jgi:hypothetical protein